MAIRSRFAVAAAAVMVVATGTLLVMKPWDGGGRGGAGPGPRPVPPKPVAVRPTEAPPPPPRTGNLSVRVEDSSGKPVADARVEVRPARDGRFASWCGDRVFAAGATDAEGRLLLDLAPEALARSREVRATRAGFVPATVRTTGSEVVLRLAPAAVLSGRVFESATGKGVGGVPLVAVRGHAWPEEIASRTVSGDDGAYSMADLPPGTYALKARPADWPDAAVPEIPLAAGESKRVDVPLLPGVRMEGRLLDSESGAPVERGRLVVPGQPGTSSGKAALLGPGGRFVLAGLPAGNAINPTDYLVLEAEGYDRRPRTETPAAYDMGGKQTREAVLRVRPEVRWEGRVLDPEGRGVPGARVVIGTCLVLREIEELDRQGEGYVGNAGGRLRETVSDAEGRFRLPAGFLLRAQGNNSGEQRLLVVHPAFAPRYECVGPDFWRSPAEIRLEPGTRLDVEVVDSAGRPEPGAEVRTALNDPNAEFRGWARGDVFGSFEGPAVADGAGRLSLPRLCPGDWEIAAWSADGLRRAVHSLTVDEPGALACRIVLEDAPPVLGTVTDAETGQPLPGAIVGLRGTRSRGHRKTATDAEGRFEFRFVEKDPSSTGFAVYVAEVPGSGLWEPTQLGDVHPGVPVALRIRCRFRETRQVSVRILDAATGSPIALGKFGSRWDDPREGAATNHGTSYFNGQIAGRFPVLDSYRMTFSAQGYEPQTTTLEGLEAQGWEVRLAPTGAPVAAESAAKFRLRVKVTGGRHPSGADGSSTAWLYFYDAETKRACLSRGGKAELTGTGTLPEFVLTESILPGPGKVLLELQVHGWYMAAPAECTVEDGKETEVAVDLIQGGSLLGGTADVDPDTRMRLVLTYPGGFVRTLWVGNDGKFFAGHVAPGTYTLALEGSEPVTATVVSGVRTDVRLER